jgi:tRNA A-37 threonylcarbamoyl transferase component Bud32
MAQNQIKVVYSTPARRAGFWTMAAVTPIWSIVAPASLGFFLAWAVGSAAPTGIVAFLCFMLLGIMFGGLGMTAFFEDDKIHLSKDGISFPLFFLPNLHFRRERLWSEVIGADISSPDAHGQQRLLLSFSSGETLSLWVAAMNPEQFEQLLVSLELWGTSCERSPALIETQQVIQNRGGVDGKLGYTQMWEEELARRFSATAFMPLEPGRMLQSNRLKVVKQLAFGGLSAIYLAEKNGTELVVLKEAVVPANSDEQAEKMAAEILDKEARLLVALSHPHIAKVCDHFVEDGRHYMEMEYIAGQDLRQCVRQNGPQSEENVIAWSKQIAEILNYLHTHEPPIVHRDLTPDNIVLRNDGQLTLIDFGAANEFVGTATGTLVGKQAYMAPEQLQGRTTLASDIYAFGATVYFLLTGRDPMPLAVASPKDVVPEISDELDRFVIDATAFDTSDRINSTKQLLERLEQLSSSPANNEPLVSV